MIVTERIESGVIVELSYENEQLTIALKSERSGSATFQISEEGTDKLKAMLFLLDESLQKAKERQAKKSYNRSLWDEAKRKAGSCSWKAKDIYEQLKAEQTEIDKELAHAGTRE